MVANGWAEETKKPDPTEVFSMEEIVITGSRMPQKKKEVVTTVEVVKVAEGREAAPRDLGEALQDISSVVVSRYGAPGATATAFLRGASAQQVLVMVDGRPVNHKGSGDFDLAQFPLDNVERVEVLKGGASSMYGANALGGVINVISRRHPTDEPRTLLTVEGGAMPKWETSDTGWFKNYRVSHQQSFGAWKMNLGGSLRQSEGHRVNSAFTGYGMDLNLGYQGLEGTEFRWSGGYTQGDVGVPGSLSFLTPSALQKTQRPYARAEVIHQFGEEGRVKGAAYWTQDHYQYSDPSNIFLMDERSEIMTVGSEWQVDGHWGEAHVWSGGIHAFKDNLTGVLNGTDVGSKPLETIGVFFQDQVKVADGLTTTVNVRYDGNSIFGGAISPQMGWLYEASSRWRWRMSAGLAFRAPNLNELYYPGFGNAILKPERGSSVDLGTEWEGEGWSGRVTAFYSRVTDLIDYTVDPVTALYLPMNVSQAYWTGLEADARFQWGGGWGGTVSGTWLTARNETAGSTLQRRPGFQAEASLSYDAPWNQRICLAVKYLGYRFDDAANVLRLPETLIAHFRITQGITDGVRMWCTVDNLGDQTYEMIGGYPMPRRTVMVGTSFGF